MATKKHQQRSNGDWQGHEQIGNGSFDPSKPDRLEKKTKGRDEQGGDKNEGTTRRRGLDVDEQGSTADEEEGGSSTADEVEKEGEERPPRNETNRIGSRIV